MSRHDMMVIGARITGGGAALAALAAGARSHHLAHSRGDNIPLASERGNNTTSARGALDLRTHLTFADHGFVVGRVGAGVRVGGAVEPGGIERPPDYRRAGVLPDKAARFLPGPGHERGMRWMGFRPSLPDSLPAIDPSLRAPRAASMPLATAIRAAHGPPAKRRPSTPPRIPQPASERMPP